MKPFSLNNISRRSLKCFTEFLRGFSYKKAFNNFSVSWLEETNNPFLHLYPISAYSILSWTEVLSALFCWPTRTIGYWTSGDLGMHLKRKAVITHERQIWKSDIVDKLIWLILNCNGNMQILKILVRRCGSFFSKSPLGFRIKAFVLPNVFFYHILLICFLKEIAASLCSVPVQLVIATNHTVLECKLLFM